MRLLQKVGDPHFVVVHWVVERRHRVRHFGDEDHKQEDMSDIELPGAAQDLRDGVQRAPRCERATIDEGGGVTRDENENLCRVVKLDRLKGEIAEDVLRNVIDKDEYQSEAAEKG